jgi:hypothetical protein
MCELLSLEEILREGVIPPEQQGGGQLQEAATTGQTQVGEAELLAQNRHIQNVRQKSEVPVVLLDLQGRSPIAVLSL